MYFKNYFIWTFLEYQLFLYKMNPHVYFIDFRRILITVSFPKFQKNHLKTTGQVANSHITTMNFSYLDRIATNDSFIYLSSKLNGGLSTRRYVNPLPFQLNIWNELQSFTRNLNTIKMIILAGNFVCVCDICLRQLFTRHDLFL